MIDGPRTGALPRVATALAAALLATLGPAQGYEWDHADGIGVRYLLYEKMKRRPPVPEHEGNQLKLAFVPSDPADFVRVKGHPLQWGLGVYEFTDRKTDGKAAPPESFREFVESADPSLAFNTRRFVQRDRKGPGGIRLWEYEDRFIPRVWTESDARNGFRLAHANCLNVRFRIERDFYAVDVDQRETGPNVIAQMLLPRASWLRVPGRDQPMSWSVTLLAFPAAAAAGHELAAGSFAEYAGRSSKNRKFVQRAAGGSTGLRLWEFQDDFRATGGAVVYHTIAAEYDVAQRRVVLQVRWPSDSPRVTPEWRKRAMATVSSLRSGAKKPGLDVGSTRYHVAAACTVTGKEVAVVVNLPVANGEKPQRELLQRARKMARSLREGGPGR